MTKLNRTFYISANKHILRIYENNQFVMKLVFNSQIHDRFKHIDIAYYYVKKRYEFKNVDIKYAHINKMIVDEFIKPLPREAFEKFRSMLGMVNIDFKR